jgi:hypothetical protein
MDLFIALVALFAGILAIVPRARQLDLQFRIGAFDKIVFCVGFMLVVYFQFYEMVERRGWVLFPKVARPRGLGPSDAMRLVLIGMTAVIGIHIRCFARLTRRNVSKFRELVEELYWTESYGELFALIQAHYVQLFEIYHDRSPCLSRFPALASFLPSRQNHEGTAAETIRFLFLSPRFVERLAKSRPYLALQFLDKLKEAHWYFDFIDLYFRELIADPTSILYTELENNQNIGDERYFIPPANRLLHYFLSDAKIADDSRVSSPIIEYIIPYLKGLGRDSSTDPYCLEMEDFQRIGRWRSSLFATIRFFDIMVREALFQGIEWHMEVYSMPELVELFLRNNRSKDQDPIAEWPTRYCYLVYETIEALCGWIESIDRVPSDRANVSLKSLDPDHENNNIPKSSILALCESLRRVLESDQINRRFKDYIADIVFRLYFKLRRTKHDDFAKVLGAALAQGGVFERAQPEYIAALSDAFDRQRMEYRFKFPTEVEDLERFWS